MTSIEWLYYNIGNEFLGLFFAFKLGWLIIFTALLGWINHRAWKEFLLVVALLIAGIVMTLMGIDTSRLAGWAFPALLFSWKFISKDQNPLRKNILKFAILANLLIPPLYVGLNRIDLPAGLYSLIIHWFS